jgi:hypothetical protein
MISETFEMDFGILASDRRIIDGPGHNFLYYIQIR